MTPWEQILGVLKEGLNLWRTYLEKKEELYNLHLRKKRTNAIKIANEMDEVVEQIFQFIETETPIKETGWKEYYKLKKEYNKLDNKFDKLS